MFLRSRPQACLTTLFLIVSALLCACATPLVVPATTAASRADLAGTSTPIRTTGVTATAAITSTLTLDPTDRGATNIAAFKARIKAALTRMKWVNFTREERASLTEAIIDTYGKVLTAIEPNDEILPVPTGFEAYVPLVRQYMTSKGIVEALESVKTIENNVGSERNGYGRPGWVGIGLKTFEVVTVPEYQAALVGKESFVSLLLTIEPMPNFTCDGPSNVRKKAFSRSIQKYEIATQTLAGMFKLAFGGDPSANLEHIKSVEAHPEDWWNDPCPQ